MSIEVFIDHRGNTKISYDAHKELKFVEAKKPLLIQIDTKSHLTNQSFYIEEKDDGLYFKARGSFWGSPWQDKKELRGKGIKDDFVWDLEGDVLVWFDSNFPKENYLGPFKEICVNEKYHFIKNLKR